MSKEIKYKDVVPNSIVARYKEVRQQYEQEPVAWRTRQVGTADWQYHNFPHILDSTCQSLYLKPPKREPLTPQQISEGNQSMFNVTREAFIKGVKFAEKAHGVTGGGE